ncbi:MAG: trigger factor [Acidobacteria bacterium]|nr:trigger factor [Acidobacteriota bacterium]
MALLEGCKHEVELTVPLLTLADETDKAVEKIRAKVQIPGFRPGKVPASLIRQRFQNEIRQDVLEAVIPKAFHQHAQAEKLEVVSQPNVVDLKWEPNEPLWFKAEFEVAPQFELEDNYRGLTVPYLQPVVEDGLVDERLLTLQQQKAEFINEDPRPAASGDNVLVELESLGGVDQPINEKEVALALGDEATLPAFNENVVGMEPGDEKQIEITYPEDYGAEHLAGKTVNFRVKLSTVRRKELPELNDEFAQDLGDFKSIDELKQAIHRSLLAEREREAQGKSREKMLDALVALYEFPIPQAYIDRQIDSTLEQRFRSLAEQGIDPRKLNLDWAKIREGQAPQARKDVRASLLLERIAEREAIHATSEEVDAEVNRIARQEREAVAAVRRRLEKDGILGRIAGHIRTEKVLSFLFEQSTKVAPEPEPEPEPEASAEPAAE